MREDNIPKFLKRGEDLEEQVPASRVSSIAKNFLEITLSALVVILFVIAFPVVYIARIINTLRHNAATKTLVELKPKVELLEIKLSDLIEQYLKETNEVQLAELKHSCRLIAQDIVSANKSAQNLILRLAALERGVSAPFSHFLRARQRFDKGYFDSRLATQRGDDGLTAVWRVRSFKKEKVSETSQKRIEWNRVFNKPFLKNLEKLEIGLQERVYQAISEILLDPKCAKGDTVQRLGGNHKGRWRYRIGDYRLVYLPEIEEKTVIFLDVGKRDEIYQKYFH